MAFAGAIIEATLHLLAQNTLKKALIKVATRNTGVKFILVDEEGNREPGGPKVETDWNNDRVFGIGRRNIQMR